jgi:hypothetical protein
MDESYRANGLPIKQDPEASSASKLPAFIDPPAGAPPYHGFSVWEDVQVDGFTFGVITDFEETETDWGDAFVIAPDNSRAGVVWSISKSPYFNEVMHQMRDAGCLERELRCPREDKGRCSQKSCKNCSSAS